MPISGVGFGDRKVGFEPAFEVVGAGREVGHERLQPGVHGGDVELEIGSFTGVEIKPGGAGGVAAVEIHAHVAQGQVQPGPIYLADNVRDGESPPVERATIELEV